MKPHTLFVFTRRSVNLAPFRVYRYYLFDKNLRKILFTSSKEELKIHMDLIGCGKILKYKTYETCINAESYHLHRSAEITFE